MTKPRPATGILIDPFACTISEVTYDSSDYTRLYPLLSHETMKVDTFTIATVAWFADRDACFVDDDGQLKEPERFFMLAGYSQPLAGKGIILGADKEGDTISAATKIEAVRKMVLFLEPFLGALVPTVEPWKRRYDA